MRKLALIIVLFVVINAFPAQQTLISASDSPEAVVAKVLEGVYSEDIQREYFFRTYRDHARNMREYRFIEQFAGQLAKAFISTMRWKIVEVEELAPDECDVIVEIEEADTVRLMNEVGLETTFFILRLYKMERRLREGEYSVLRWRCIMTVKKLGDKWMLYEVRRGVKW